MQQFRATSHQEMRVEFISHFSPTHTEEAFCCMKIMRSKCELCDVNLLVGEPQRRIAAHRLVLASCSPYFQAMFTSELIESRQRDITLQGVDADAIELLVDFAYTARIQVSEDNVQALLPASSLLQLTSVKDACCEFLKNQLHPSNCLGIRAFADTHTCVDLLESSHRFALQHFLQVSQTEEFMLLSVEQVLDLISNSDVNVENEEQVYNAVINWVKFDVDNRREFVRDLLPFVRLPLLTRECLMTRVESEELIRNTPDCKDLLIEAMKYHLLPEQRSVLQSPRTVSRKPTGQVPILFAIGGGSLFAIHSECECYDPRIDRWCMVTPMSTKRARVGVGTVCGRIYAVGGYDGSNDLATVEAYCPQSNQWLSVPSMGTRRSCLGVAVLNGLIYAIGGYDGASCLNSVERFDPLTAQWTSVAAMNTRRRYVRVGVVNGIIYAIGGYDGSAHLNTVECFDPMTNTWRIVASMASRRSSAGVAVLNDMLYVVGGNDGASCLNTMERYEPVADAWTCLAPMSVRRSTHDVAVIDSILFAVGGNDGSSSLNSIEKYDPETNKWTSVVSMSTRRSSVGVTVAHVLLL